jgi:chaperonin GroES
MVRRAAKETKLASGLLLPETTTKDPNEGTVVSVGPGERDVTGTLHQTTLKAGDSVLLPEYGGMKVKIEDEELFLFRESDILGKFE